MKALKKPAIGLIICLLFVQILAPVSIFETEDELSDDVIILYTNDVHTYIDGSLSYDVIGYERHRLG